MRVAMLSFAHMHAWSYAGAVQRAPGAMLSVIWDEDESRGRHAAEVFGCPFEPDLEVVLASDITAVVICAANAHHRDLTIRAARAGKHILCEKPIAVSVADAEAMVDAARQAGVQLMTAFPVRYAPPVVRARQAVLEGRVGEVLAIRGTNHGRMPGGWFIEPALSGGGAVMDHTVHVADLMRWITGREFTSVFAEVGTRFYDVAIDDCGMLSLEMEGGLIATLDPSWSRPAAFPTWGDVTLEIVGTRGTITVDAFGQNVTLYNNADRVAAWAGFGADIDSLMIADFLGCVRAGRPVPVTGEDGLRAMEVALLAYESARRGEPVGR
ncbi:MAG TPA: Gfo/Idh/MocA family oxidoreductase [Symbiobacteriaceae bacterium]|jgi:predicted dehydrogenase